MKKSISIIMILSLLMSSVCFYALGADLTGTDINNAFAMQDYVIYSQNFSSSSIVTDYVDRSLTTSVPFYNEMENALSVVDATVNGGAVKALKSVNNFQSVMTKKTYNTPVTYSVNMGVNTAYHAGFTLRMPTTTGIYAGYLTSGYEGSSGDCIDVDLQNVDRVTNSMNITIVNPNAKLYDSPHFSFDYPSGTDVSKLNKYDIIDKGDTIAIQITPDGSSTATKLCIIKLSNIVDNHYTSGTVYNGNGVLVGEFTKNVPVASRFGVHSRTPNFTFTNFKVLGTPTIDNIDNNFEVSEGGDEVSYSQNFSSSANVADYVDNSLITAIPFYNEMTNSLSVTDATVSGSAVKALKSTGNFQSVMTKKTYIAPVAYSVNMGVDTGTHAGFTLRMPTTTSIYAGYYTTGYEGVSGACIDVDLQNVDLTSGCMNITIANTDAKLKDSPHYSFPLPEGTDIKKLNKYDIIDKGNSIAIQITPEGSDTPVRLCVILLSGIVDNYYTNGLVFRGNGTYTGQFTKKVSVDSRFGVHSRTGSFTFTNFAVRVLPSVRDIDTYFSVSEDGEKTLYSQDFSSSATVTDYVDNSSTSAVPFYNEFANALALQTKAVNGNNVTALVSTNNFQSVMTRKIYSNPVKYSFNLGVNTATHAGFTLRMPKKSGVVYGYLTSGKDSVEDYCIDVDIQNVDLKSNSINVTIATPGIKLIDSPHFSFALPAGTDVSKLNKYDIVEKGNSIAIQITPDGTSTPVKLCVIMLKNLNNDFYTDGMVYDGNGNFAGLFSGKVYAASRFGVHSRTSSFSFANFKVSVSSSNITTGQYFEMASEANNVLYEENFSASTAVTDYVDSSTTLAVPFYNESANSLAIQDKTIGGNTVKALVSTGNFQSVMTKSTFSSPVKYSFNLGVNTSTHAGFTLRMPKKSGVVDGYLTSGNDSVEDYCIDVDLKNVDLKSNSINVTIAAPGIKLINSPHYSFALPAGTDVSKLNKYDVIEKGNSIAIQITPEGTSTPVELCVILLNNLVDSIYNGGSVYDGDGTCLGTFTEKVYAASRFGVHARTANFTFTNFEVFGYKNKSNLIAAIEEAEAFNAADFEPDAWSKVQVKLDAAIAANENTGLTQKEINTIANELVDSFKYLMHTSNAGVFELKKSISTTPRELCALNFNSTDDVISNYFGNTRFFTADNAGTGKQVLENKAMVLKENFSACISSNEFDTPVQYSFKIAADPGPYTNYTHSGISLRTSTNAAIFGGYEKTDTDTCSAIDIDIANGTKGNGNFVITINGLDQKMSESPSYSVPYTTGFDPKTMNDVTIIDNGNLIGIQIAGQNIGFIRLSGFQQDSYTYGWVYDAAGNQIGQRFDKDVPENSNIGFHQRTGITTVDDIVIKTTSSQRNMNIAVNVYQASNVTKIPFTTSPKLISTVKSLDPNSNNEVVWKILQGEAELTPETFYSYDAKTQSIVRVTFKNTGHVVIRCSLKSEPGNYCDYSFDVQISRSMLKEAIDQYQNLSTSQNDYDPVTWDNLMSALIKAINTYNNEESSQSEIFSVAEALTIALDGLQPAESIIDPPLSGNNTSEQSFNAEELTVDMVRGILASATSDSITIRVVNGKAVLTTEMQQEFKNSGKKVRFEFHDDADSTVLAWQLNNFGDCSYDIDLSYNQQSPYEKSIVNALGNKKSKTIVSLKHKGALPSGTTIIFRNDVGFAKKDSLTLRYLNLDSKKLEVVKTKVLLTADVAYLGFSVNHASEYVIVKDDMASISKYTKTDVTPKTASPVLLIVIICVVVALVISAGITAFLIFRKKKKNIQG